jgi:ABC-type bacteriocin/lantibiotic exporter with double-glycine peptidase domain
MQFLSDILAILDQKERVKFFLFAFFDVLISALDIAFLALTILVVNFYIKGSLVPAIRWFPHWLFLPDSILLIAVFFIPFGIKNIIAYLVTVSRFRFIYGVASRLSDRNIRQYLKTDYMHFVNIDSAVQIRKISQQPIEFSNYILTNLQQVVSQSVLVLFTIGAILLFHASLFLLLFTLLMPGVVLLGWLLKRRLKDVRQHIKHTSAESLKTLKEALSGYIESNIYQKDDFLTSRYLRQQQLMNQYICTQQALQSLPSRLIEIFAILGFFILIVINKLSAGTPAVDLFTVGVFMAAAYKIIPGVVKILNSAGQMKTYEFTVNDLLADAGTMAITKSSPDPIRSIRMEKIHFRYNGYPVLGGTSLEILPGDFIGISAGSGRGKTTLMHILLGFIEQEQGAIIINHKIKTACERQGYHSRISYMKQQPFLLHDTVRNNITLEEAGYDEEKLKDAIDFCGLDTLLQQQPLGDGLIITENGRNLSGGQRQRLMLARAMYHDFDLLIMDEPFGEIDQPSENDILRRLTLLARRGKMIIFITHSNAGLSFCNKMVSLDD